MRKLFAATSAVVFVLVTAAPAFADAAVPLHGTYSTEDFSETVVLPPTSAEPELLITIQIDTNLGPVTQTLEIPFSTWVFHGNGGFHFQGLGTVDFGSGNLLRTRVNGRFSFFATITTVDQDVIVGEGIYVGAAGTFHISGFAAVASPPVGGYIAGVIR